jgi:hypothetical protein
VGYFRRVWKNFQVTDNLLVAPEDFTQFSLTVPTDSRLSTSGQTLTGLYNVVPTKFGQFRTSRALRRLRASRFDHWNGFDISCQCSSQNGLVSQGGMGSGQAGRRQLRDRRQAAGDAESDRRQRGNTANAPAQWRPAQVLSSRRADADRFKRWPSTSSRRSIVQVSGSFRSTPGTNLSVGYTATNADPRDLVNARPAALGNRAEHGDRHREAERGLHRAPQELDMRIGKVLKFGNTKTSSAWTSTTR